MVGEGRIGVGAGDEVVKGVRLSGGGGQDWCGGGR